MAEVYIVIAVLSTIGIIGYFSVMAEHKNFNNGICTKCGDELEYSTGYMEERNYTCPTCGHKVFLQSAVFLPDKKYLEYKDEIKGVDFSRI